jgi:hypothetical protein
MTFIAAAIIAAAAAWLLNRLAVDYLGDRSIAWVVPLVEEGCKTGAALWLGAPLLLTHGAFGMVEAWLDIQGHHNYRAGWISLAGHLFYGWLTAWAWTVTGHWGWGLLSAVLVHTGWNTLIWLAGKRKAGMG